MKKLKTYYFKLTLEKNLAKEDAIFMDLYGDSLTSAHTKKEALKLSNALKEAAKWVREKGKHLR